MLHRFRVKVRFSELDPYDHVNHTFYLTYCETARIELLDEVGWGMSRLEEQGRRIVVTDMVARFLAAASLGDELTIETSVIEIRRATSRWRQRILRADQGIFDLEVGAAVLDMRGRPARFPAGFAEALAAYSD